MSTPLEPLPDVYFGTVSSPPFAANRTVLGLFRGSSPRRYALLACGGQERVIHHIGYMVFHDADASSGIPSNPNPAAEPPGVHRNDAHVTAGAGPSPHDVLRVVRVPPCRHVAEPVTSGSEAATTYYWRIARNCQAQPVPPWSLQPPRFPA
jgi:hypothetical protein